MDGWMDGWMGGWARGVHGWMGGWGAWMDGWMGGEGGLQMLILSVLLFLQPKPPKHAPPPLQPPPTGFDLENGRLDVSVHPFTGGAHPTDVRMTTRFKAHDLTEGLTGGWMGGWMGWVGGWGGGDCGAVTTQYLVTGEYVACLALHGWRSPPTHHARMPCNQPNYQVPSMRPATLCMSRGATCHQSGRICLSTRWVGGDWGAWMDGWMDG